MQVRVENLRILTSHLAGQAKSKKGTGGKIACSKDDDWKYH
jgi:hypothetical protein